MLDEAKKLIELCNKPPQTVTECNELTDKVIAEQRRLHVLMQGRVTNDEWQSLSDMHFDLRKARQQIQVVASKLIRNAK